MNVSNVVAALSIAINAAVPKEKIADIAKDIRRRLENNPQAVSDRYTMFQNADISMIENEIIIAGFIAYCDEKVTAKDVIRKLFTGND